MINNAERVVRLEQLAADMVVDGDSSEIEAALLRQDELEWEAGEHYFPGEE